MSDVSKVLIESEAELNRIAAQTPREEGLVIGPWETIIDGVLQSTSNPQSPALLSPDRTRELEAVARALDEFQTYYQRHTYGDKMPGNEFYAGKLMVIVTAARSALALPSAPPPDQETP